MRWIKCSKSFLFPWHCLSTIVASNYENKKWKQFRISFLIDWLSGWYSISYDMDIQIKTRIVNMMIDERNITEYNKNNDVYAWMGMFWCSTSTCTSNMLFLTRIYCCKKYRNVFKIFSCITLYPCNTLHKTNLKKFGDKCMLWSTVVFISEEVIKKK